MKEMLRKLQLIGALALGSVPVVPVLFAYTVPELLPFAWVYPAAYLIVSMIGIRIPGKWRLLYGTVTAAALVFGPLAAAGPFLFPVLAANAVYGALFLWSLTLAGWPADWELPAIPRILGFAVHVVGQLVVLFASLETTPALASCVPGLRWSFLAYILLTLLSLNRDSLNNASDEKRSVSQGMRRKNTLMTLGLFGLAALASFIPYIYDWVKGLILWLVAMLLRLLAWLTPEQQTGTAPAPEGTPEGLPPMEESDPSLLARILEIAAMVIGGVLVLGLLGFLVYWLGRKLRGLLRRLWTMLERYAAAASEDYQDEITDTRRDPEGERLVRARRPGLRRGDRRGPMSPGEAIRHRYLRLLRRHPEWTAATTARENIPEEMAGIYEQARYSGHALTEGEAERFRSGTKGL